MKSINASNKSLIILVDRKGLMAADPTLLEACDRVAMTPSAMAALEERGLNYFTFDDFYSYRQFRRGNSELINVTDDLFSALDRKYESFLNFPRAFKSNIYWFLGIFADMYYISEICRKITETYSRVYLAGNSEHKEPFNVNPDFSPAGLIFTGSNKRLSDKVDMVRTCISSKYLWFNDNNGRHPNLNIKKRQLIRLVRSIPGKILRACRKILLKFESSISKQLQRKNKVIFVIQDGYEVSLLKKNIPGFLLINPISQLLRVVKSDNANRLNLDLLFIAEVKQFVKEWFPPFEKHVLKMFTLYHDRVLCRLNSFMDVLRKTFKNHSPVALFYSISAQNTYEDACAYYANQKGIPVFYFQHGGTPVFYIDPYQRYVERNSSIEKIKIFHSKVEKELFADDAYPGGPVLGSIKFYNLFTAEKKSMPRTPRKKVLYCACPFNFTSSRGLMVNVCDRELLAVNKDIIDLAYKFNLDLDIKVHPCAEDYNYLHFANLLKNYHGENIRILKGFPAESILRNYGLLILDYVGSAMFPTSIGANIPVIVYFKDTSCLRRETMPDIESRFYLARNRSDLEKYLDLYKRENLASKFSLDIVSKYAFPVTAGDPRVNISDYIRKKIPEGKLSV